MSPAVEFNEVQVRSKFTAEIDKSPISKWFILIMVVIINPFVRLVKCQLCDRKRRSYNYITKSANNILIAIFVLITVGTQTFPTLYMNNNEKV